MQDLAKVAEKGKAELPPALSARISFVAHDFFTPNPVKDADVFLFRLVLHDWPDDDAVRILRRVTPSMTPKTRLVVCDVVVPPAGALPYLEERQVRSVDMQMMTLFNSWERSLEEWEGLFAKADPALRVASVAKPVGSYVSIMEVTLTGKGVA